MLVVPVLWVPICSTTCVMRAILDALLGVFHQPKVGVLAGRGVGLRALERLRRCTVPTSKGPREVLGSTTLPTRMRSHNVFWIQDVRK